MLVFYIFWLSKLFGYHYGDRKTRLPSLVVKLFLSVCLLTIVNIVFTITSHCEDASFARLI